VGHYAENKPETSVVQSNFDSLTAEHITYPQLSPCTNANVGFNNQAPYSYIAHASGFVFSGLLKHSTVEYNENRLNRPMLIAATVFDLQMTSCPTSDGAVAMTTPVGYLSNTLYEAYSMLGRPGCPWIVRGDPGQRVELTLYTLHAPRPLATTGAAGNLVSFNVHAFLLKHRWNE
jgi:hypothetical protein